MARVVALLPDLLFGSKVQGMLAAAGHDVTAVGSAAAVLDVVGGADVVVVDLCEDSAARVGTLAGAVGDAKLLAFYLHTDVATRTLALEAGFDVVVPRSRMAREGVAVLEGLLAGV